MDFISRLNSLNSGDWTKHCQMGQFALAHLRVLQLRLAGLKRLVDAMSGRLLKWARLMMMMVMRGASATSVCVRASVHKSGVRVCTVYEHQMCWINDVPDLRFTRAVKTTSWPATSHNRTKTAAYVVVPEAAVTGTRHEGQRGQPSRNGIIRRPCSWPYNNWIHLHRPSERRSSNVAISRNEALGRQTVSGVSSL
jgi:hypothetical protein